MERWDPLSAAALAGGKSRRMGADKAFLPVVEGGPAMLAMVLDRLAKLSHDVMVVANDRVSYAPFGVRVVPDVHVGAGALGGIHAALSEAKEDYCLVVACDMPFLNSRLLQRMAQAPRDYDVLIPRLPGESRQGTDGHILHTLHAIYSKRCLPNIQAHLTANSKQVIQFFEEVAVRTIDLKEVLDCDPELRSFFNTNTPEALEMARKLVTEEEHLSGHLR